MEAALTGAGRVIEVIRVDENVCPRGLTKWKRGTPYWGEGPYLGQKGRYELLMVPTASLVEE